MVTVRWAREGLRLVRVPTPAPSEAPPPAVVGTRPDRRTSSPEGAFPHAAGSDPAPSARAKRIPGAKDEDYYARLHRFGRWARAVARRRRREPPWLTPERLREARRREGVGQWELARRLGVSRSTVAAAEHGHRTAHPALAQWATGILSRSTEEVHG